MKWTIIALLLLSGCIERNAQDSAPTTDSAATTTTSSYPHEDANRSIKEEVKQDILSSVNDISDGNHDVNIQTINLKTGYSSFVSRHNEVKTKGGKITCIYFKDGTFVESDRFDTGGLVDENGISKILSKDSIEYLITVDK